MSSSEAQAVHGAVEWLIKAYLDYRDRVINREIGYKAFMEENHVKLSMPIFLKEDASYDDFLQEAIDRDKVKHILENRKFTEEYFAVSSFEEEDAVKMIARYNAIGIENKKKGNPHEEILPIKDYPQTAIDRLAAVFRKHKLLCPDITSDDLILLLTTGNPSCKYMIPPYSNNRDLGFVLYLLVAAGSLSRFWSADICLAGMLLTSSGEKMTRKNLSAAVHSFDNYLSNQLNDKRRIIEQDVLAVLKNIPSAMRNLKK